VTPPRSGSGILPAWVPAVETKPAPMPLLLVQSFVNTWEGDSGVDLLGEPKPALRWLAGAGLSEEGRGLDQLELSRARAVREAIRALLVHNGGGPAPTKMDLRPLDQLAGAARLQVAVDRSGLVELDAKATGGHIKMARLLLIIRDAQKDGTWSRLKACHNGDCRWAFYDRSHAGRGAWCDMTVCGNRIKNRNLRSRRPGRPGR
jgi:predicted RNA-binding Zn ribbon-like protein